MSGLQYFEDVLVGARFSSEPYRISEEEIIAFASHFDPQPFHVDPRSGEQSVFGGLVASGWHTAALTMRLLVSAHPFAGGLIGTQVDVRWRRPTRPGDELKVVADVTHKEAHRARSDVGWVVIRAETRNAREEVLQILSSRFLVPTREATQDQHPAPPAVTPIK